MVRTNQDGSNFYAEYMLEELTIALVCERGEWSVEINSPDGDGYRVDVWQSLLGESTPPGERMSVEEQATFAEGHIGALLALVGGGGASLGARLAMESMRRFAAVFGSALPPDTVVDFLRSQLVRSRIDPGTYAIMREPGGARFHLYQDGESFVVAYRPEGAVVWEQRFVAASEACSFFLTSVLSDLGQT